MIAFVLIASKLSALHDPQIVSRLDRVDLPWLHFVPDQHLTWSNNTGTLRLIAWQAFGELGGLGSHWWFDYDTVTLTGGLPVRLDGPWSPDATWAEQISTAWPDLAREPAISLAGPFVAVRLEREGTGSVITGCGGSIPLYVAETERLVAIASRPWLAATAIAGDPDALPRDSSVEGSGFVGVLPVAPGSRYIIDAEGPRLDDAIIAPPGPYSAERLEGHLRGLLRSLAGLTFSNRVIAVLDDVRGRLVRKLIESEGLSDSFDVQTFAASKPPAPESEDAIRRAVFRSSGTVAFDILSEPATLDDVLRISTFAACAYGEGASGGEPSVWRRLATENETAPIPWVDLFSDIESLAAGGPGCGSDAANQVAVELLRRLEADSIDPVLDPEPDCENAPQTVDPSLARMTGRILSALDEDHPLFNVVEPEAVHQLAATGLNDPGQFHRAASLLTTAIWLGGDELPSRLRRVDDAPVRGAQVKSGSVHDAELAARNPLIWAEKAVARPVSSPLGQDSSVCAVIPHFGAERFLADSIDSLVRQTRPLQAIVVVDDCSAEPPIEIVNRFPGVTLLQSRERSGPFRIVQEVITNTAYDAYLFQDADDWSAPDRLEILLDESIRTGAELVGSQGMRLIEDELDVVPYDHEIDPAELLKRHPISNPVHHPSTLVTRDLLVRSGGFATGFRFGADTEFVRRVAHVARLRNVPHRLYYYRTRRDSLTGAPDTGIRSEARRLNWAAQHDRARSNAIRREHELPPMLLPMSVTAPVRLNHVTGPPVCGEGSASWLAKKSAEIPVQVLRPETIRQRSESPAQPFGGIPRPVFVFGSMRSGASLLATALAQHGNLMQVHDVGWMVKVSASIYATYWHDARRQDGGDLASSGVEPEDLAAQMGAAIDALILRGVSEELTDGQGLQLSRLARSAITAPGRWVATGDRLYESAFALHRLFPHARFIHVLRNPEEVADSLSIDNSRLYRSRFVHMRRNQAFDLWIDAVKQCLDIEEALGADRVLRVERQNLLGDPERAMNDVLSFLGEQFDPPVLRSFR